MMCGRQNVALSFQKSLQYTCNHIDLRTTVVYNSSEVTQDSQELFTSRKRNQLLWSWAAHTGLGTSTLSRNSPTSRQKRRQEQNVKDDDIVVNLIFRYDWERHSYILLPCWTPSKLDIHTSRKHRGEQFS